MTLQRFLILLLLGVLPTWLSIWADEVPISQPLEVAYDSVFEKLRALPDEQRIQSLEQLRSTMSVMVTGLTAYEDKSSEVGRIHSNLILENVVSAGFHGELIRLIRKVRQGDKDALRLIDQRVGAFVRLYPLSPKSSAEERISVTLFLAKAATVDPDVVRTSSRTRLAEVEESDRLPLLIALAGLGDQEAQKSLKPLDSAEAKKLQRVFQIFSKQEKPPGGIGVSP